MRRNPQVPQLLQADPVRRYQGEGHRLQHQTVLQAGAADWKEDYRGGKSPAGEIQWRDQRRNASCGNEQCLWVPGCVCG